jgi:hypothetical protein
MRAYRAGDTVEDICRACKLDRLHTVIVADPSGVPVRVQCDYCGSQHQYRGGPADSPRARSSPSAASGNRISVKEATRPAFPLMSERERVGEPCMVEVTRDVASGETPVRDESRVDLELLLRRIIREEAGVTMAVPAEKWRNGTFVLKPGNPALQEKSWPIETLFHKIVMIRNRLRTLEQQVNASDLAEDAKLKIQGYITGCYGSLTSFNILFAEEDDQFRGSGGD